MRRNKLFLSLILLACVSGANAKEYYGKPWINSNIKGNIPNKPPRLQDNFELAVNYDSYKKVKIPMLGKTESLNAALAGAIIMYESERQSLLG